jgi:hypothetical protein
MVRDQDKVIKHLSLITGKHTKLIEHVVYHPLKFTKKVMVDPDDYRPIRIRCFGVFAPKYMRNKCNFQRLTYMAAALRSYPDLHKDVFIDPTFSTGDEAMAYIRELFDANDVKSFNAVYLAILNAITKQEKVVVIPKKRNKKS